MKVDWSRYEFCECDWLIPFLDIEDKGEMRNFPNNFTPVGNNCVHLILVNVLNFEVKYVEYMCECGR